MPASPRPPVWSDPRHRLGLRGEVSVIGFLTSQGWRVEAHRFRLGRQELDLVARRGRLVAFIEVKTRRSTRFGRGREAIGWRKRAALQRVAEAWRQRHGQPDDLYRFDVVEVCGGEVIHLEDAWRP